MEKELVKPYEDVKIAGDSAASEGGDLAEEELKDCPINNKVLFVNQNGEHGEVRLQDDHGPSQESSESVDDNVMLGNHSKEEVGKLNQFGQSPSPSAKASPSPINANSPGATTKGYGLKKWRRLRREIPKDATTNLDSIKMLKRGANVVDGKQPSDVSISTTEAIYESPGAANGFGLASSSPGYSLLVNTAFSTGTDSYNLEDRNSKSSTAASAPRYRHDALRALGHQRDKQRVKNFGGKNVGSGGSHSQTGKSPAMDDASKKAKGEIVKIEEGNSISSMESDSRSNFVFFRGTSVIGDQTLREKSVKHDIEDADDESASKEQFEVLRSDFSKNIIISQNSSSDASIGKSNDQLSRDCDPLINSMLMLQSAQAKLEKEVQQFGDLGKGIHSFCTDLEENAASPAHSMSLRPEFSLGHTLHGCVSKSNHVSLNNDGQILRRLKEKELEVVKLEVTLERMKSPVEDTMSTIQMEAELESLFKLKVEAEVEFVAMTRSTEELSVVVQNHIKLLKEQKSLVTELAQSSRSVAHTENKDIMPQDHSKEALRESEEIAKMQRRVVKFTKCFFLQLILLLVFGFFFSQLSPKSAVVVVPT